jgi:hypothetical protein
MLAELALARLKTAIDRQEFDKAAQLAPEALERSEGDSERYPEALYWSAVADYKSTNDGNRLVAGWSRLLDKFPDSEWGKRASFIRM